MKYIIWGVTLLLASWFANKKSSLVPKGEVSNEPLTKKEKVISFFLLLLNPLFTEIILYSKWKEVLPVKVKQLRPLFLTAIAIYIIIIAGVLVSSRNHVIQENTNQPLTTSTAVKSDTAMQTYLAQGKEGTDLFSQGKYKESLVVFEKMAQSDPIDAEVYMHIGQAKEASNDLVGAFDAYSHALTFKYNDSNDRWAYYHRATVYAQQGKFDLAESDFKNSLNAKADESGMPSNAIIHYQIGDVVLLQNKNSVEGCTLVKQAISEGFNKSDVDQNMINYCKIY